MGELRPESPAEEGSQSGEALGIACLVAADLFFQARLVAGLKRLGCDVEAAGAVDEVLHKAEAMDPDLLLLDMGARSFDWRELLRSLRGREALSGLRVLAFGSHVDRQGHQEALDLGADFTCSNGAISMNLPEMVRRALRAEA